MFQWLWQTMRQWRYPPEFRIKAPAMSPEVLAVLQRLEELIRSEFTYQEDDALLNFVAELATGLWRLRRRLQNAPEDHDDWRRAKRICQALWDAMEEKGIVVHDHTGENYDPGMSVEVLTFREDKTLTRDQIVETIKPSVFLRGRLIQWSVVIVGTPNRKEGNDDAVND